MGKTSKRLTSIAGAFAISTVIVTSGVMAAGHVKNIAVRQAAMKIVGENIGILVGTAKGKIEFDAAKIKAAALAIKANLEKNATLYPEGTGPDSGVKTRAKDEIWLDTEGFAAALKTAIAAADGMAGVTKKADLLPALGKLGGGCKGCHEKFRAPKQ